VAAAPKILVTGGTGFVGGHLARGFAAAGCRVVLAVRRGRSVAGFDLWPCDADGLLTLPSGVDFVVHAAATSPDPGITVGQLLDDNVAFTRRLVAAAQVAGVRRLVLASSMSVYGTIACDTIDETTAIVDPDAYGLTKRLCETLVEDGCGKLPALAIRLPAVIGRGASRHWLARTAALLAAGAPIRFFHADAPFNTAIHVDDLAAFVLEVLTRGWDGYDAVNVASGGSITVRGAVNRLRLALHSQSPLFEVAPHRPSFTISIARATARFGFAPMTIAAALDRYAEDVASATRHDGVPKPAELEGTS
jgi:nucleoside-diphosphate-sugar epimerase